MPSKPVVNVKNGYIHITRKHPVAKGILLAIKARRNLLTVCDQAQESVSLHGTYWDGGSRSDYYMLEFTRNENGTNFAHAPNVREFPHCNPSQFGGPRETPKVKVTDGIGIVRAGIFYGKPSYPYLYLSKADLAQFRKAIGL